MVSLVSCILWGLYTTHLGDLLIMLPQFIGVALKIFEIIILLVFDSRKSPKEEIEKKKTD